MNTNAGITIRAACEILGIKYYDIYYLEKTGKISKIPRTTSGIRVFHAENLTEIKNAFKGLKKRRPRERR